MPLHRSAALAAVAASLSEAFRMRSSNAVAYDEFLKDLGHQRGHNDAVGYDVRLALFEKRRYEVMRHNSQPGISWTATINKFADYTDTEFSALLGHRPGIDHHAARAGAASLLESQPSQELAQSVDWSHKVNASKHAKDQGSCGSCWAVASAGALEVFAEIAGTPVEVSYEQLVDCTPNPDECGGKGGCEGATSELAFDYVQKSGLVLKSQYHGYQSGGDGKCKQPSSSTLKTSGFTRLAVNKLHPLLEAVSTQGPVVVSADASGWSMYQKGVFDGCGKDATINHAILLMGYGRDESLRKDFWLIRNSWGESYGEGGYIRLLRHASDTGDAGYCGVDKKPLDGVGCKGGPAELAVCGMCGVLSDSAYPTGVHVATTSA